MVKTDLNAPGTKKKAVSTARLVVERRRARARVGTKSAARLPGTVETP
jgi:hypothetical protein